jgi:hypothetical protein
MQLEPNIMFLALNAIQLFLIRLLPLLDQATLLEIRDERIRRRSIIQVIQQPINVVTADTQVFLLRLEERDVVGSAEVGGWRW